MYLNTANKLGGVSEEHNNEYNDSFTRYLVLDNLLSKLKVLTAPFT